MNPTLLLLGLALGAATVGLLILTHRLAFAKGVVYGAERATETLLDETEPTDAQVDRIVGAIEAQWARERAGARRPN